MLEFTSLDPAERELEQALRSLEPKACSQQEMWYRAGMEVGRRHARIWKGTAAAVVALSMALVICGLKHHRQSTPDRALIHGPAQ